MQVDFNSSGNISDLFFQVNMFPVARPDGFLDLCVVGPVSRLAGLTVRVYDVYELDVVHSRLAGNGRRRQGRTVRKQAVSLLQMFDAARDASREARFRCH